jgi:hypothetical protein
MPVVAPVDSAPITRPIEAGRNEWESGGGSSDPPPTVRLLTPGRIHRLSGRMALRATVIRTLAAVARPKVWVGKRRGRRCRRERHREQREGKLAPHPAYLLSSVISGGPLPSVAETADV